MKTKRICIFLFVLTLLCAAFALNTFAADEGTTVSEGTLFTVNGVEVTDVTDYDYTQWNGTTVVLYSDVTIGVTLTNVKIDLNGYTLECTATCLTQQGTSYFYSSREGGRILCVNAVHNTDKDNDKIYIGYSDASTVSPCRIALTAKSIAPCRSKFTYLYGCDIFTTYNWVMGTDRNNNSLFLNSYGYVNTVYIDYCNFYCPVYTTVFATHNHSGNFTINITNTNFYGKGDLFNPVAYSLSTQVTANLENVHTYGEFQISSGENSFSSTLNKYFVNADSQCTFASIADSRVGTLPEGYVIAGKTATSTIADVTYQTSLTGETLTFPGGTYTANYAVVPESDVAFAIVDGETEHPMTASEFTAAKINGKTVKLYSDMTLNETLTNATIDLNGYSLSSTVGFTTTGCFIYNSNTEKASTVYAEQRLVAPTGNYCTIYVGYSANGVKADGRITVVAATTNLVSQQYGNNCNFNNVDFVCTVACAFNNQPLLGRMAGGSQYVVENCNFYFTQVGYVFDAHNTAATAQLLLDNCNIYFTNGGGISGKYSWKDTNGKPVIVVKNTNAYGAFSASNENYYYQIDTESSFASIPYADGKGTIPEGYRWAFDGTDIPVSFTYPDGTFEMTSDSVYKLIPTDSAIAFEADGMAYINAADFTAANVNGKKVVLYTDITYDATLTGVTLDLNGYTYTTTANPAFNGSDNFVYSSEVNGTFCMPAITSGADTVYFGYSDAATTAGERFNVYVTATATYDGGTLYFNNVNLFFFKAYSKWDYIFWTRWDYLVSVTIENSDVYNVGGANLFGGNTVRAGFDVVIRNSNVYGGSLCGPCGSDGAIVGTTNPFEFYNSKFFGINVPAQSTHFGVIADKDCVFTNVTTSLVNAPDGYKWAYKAIDHSVSVEHLNGTFEKTYTGAYYFVPEDTAPLFVANGVAYTNAADFTNANLTGKTVVLYADMTVTDTLANVTLDLNGYNLSATTTFTSSGCYIYNSNTEKTSTIFAGTRLYTGTLNVGYSASGVKAAGRITIVDSYPSVGGKDKGLSGGGWNNSANYYNVDFVSTVAVGANSWNSLLGQMTGGSSYNAEKCNFYFTVAGNLVHAYKISGAVLTLTDCNVYFVNGGQIGAINGGTVGQVTVNLINTNVYGAFSASNTTWDFVIGDGCILGSIPYAEGHGTLPDETYWLKSEAGTVTPNFSYYASADATEATVITGEYAYAYVVEVEPAKTDVTVYDKAYGTEGNTSGTTLEGVHVGYTAALPTPSTYRIGLTVYVPTGVYALYDAEGNFVANVTSTDLFTEAWVAEGALSAYPVVEANAILFTANGEYYTNAADFTAANVNGKTVVLYADMTVTETFKVVTLDLNGYNLIVNAVLTDGQTNFVYNSNSEKASTITANTAIVFATTKTFTYLGYTDASTKATGRITLVSSVSVQNSSWGNQFYMNNVDVVCDKTAHSSNTWLGQLQSGAFGAENCTFNFTGGAVLLHTHSINGGSFTFKSCTFNMNGGSFAGVHWTYTGAENATTLVFEGCTVNGVTTWATDYIVCWNFSFDENCVVSSIPTTGITTIPEGYRWAYDSSVGTYKMISVDSTEYAFLVNDVAYLSANDFGNVDLTGKKVVLNADVTITSALLNVTIDLNGYNLSATTAFTEKGCYIYNSNTEKASTIWMTQYLISGYEDLHLGYSDADTKADGRITLVSDGTPVQHMRNGCVVTMNKVDVVFTRSDNNSNTWFGHIEPNATFKAYDCNFYFTNGGVMMLTKTGTNVVFDFNSCNFYMNGGRFGGSVWGTPATNTKLNFVDCNVYGTTGWATGAHYEFSFTNGCVVSSNPADKGLVANVPTGSWFKAEAGTVTPSFSYYASADATEATVITGEYAYAYVVEEKPATVTVNVYNKPYGTTDNTVAGTLDVELGQTPVLPTVGSYVVGMTVYVPNGTYVIYNALGAKVYEGTIGAFDEALVSAGTLYVYPVFDEQPVAFAIVNGNEYDYRAAGDLTAANVNGKKVVLYADATAITDTRLQNVTIDLNGYTLSATSIFTGNGCFIYNSNTEKSATVNMTQQLIAWDDGVLYLGYSDVNTKADGRITLFSEGTPVQSCKARCSLVMNNVDVVFTRVAHDGNTWFGQIRPTATMKATNCNFYFTNGGVMLHTDGADNVVFDFDSCNLYFNGGRFGGSVWNNPVNNTKINFVNSNVYGTTTWASSTHYEFNFSANCVISSNPKADGFTTVVPEGYYVAAQTSSVDVDFTYVVNGTEASVVGTYNAGYAIVKFDNESYVNKFYHNISLDANMIYNVYVPVSMGIAGATVGDTNVLDVNSVYTIGGKDYYLISIPMVPQDAMIIHTLKVALSEVDATVTMNFSVVDYLRQLLHTTTEGGDSDYLRDSKELAKYVLYYCKQVILAGDSAADVSVINLLLGSFELSEDDKALVENVYDVPSNDAVHGATLYLADKVGFVIGVKEGYVGTVTVSVGTQTVTATYTADAPAGANEVIIVSDLSVFDFRADVVVTYTGGANGTFNYNLATYVARKQTEVGYATYAYSKLAEKYNTTYGTPGVVD